MPDTKTYTLAHPLDAKFQRGSRMVDSPFTTKDLNAGDPIELDDGQARQLARAGYLNLDSDGKPLVGGPAAADSDAGSEMPPLGGTGSDRAAWADYAGRNGVDVTDDMNRDAIVAALDRAGIATQRA